MFFIVTLCLISLSINIRPRIIIGRVVLSAFQFYIYLSLTVCKFALRLMDCVIHL